MKRIIDQHIKCKKLDDEFNFNKIVGITNNYNVV